MSFVNTAKEEMKKRYEQLEQEMSGLELKTLSAKYRTLEARDTAARTFRSKVQSLKKQAVKGKQKASEFSDDSTGAWNTFREGMENAWEELRTSCSAAYDEFKENYSDDEQAVDASDAVCSSFTTDGKTTSASPSMAASGQCSTEAKASEKR